MNPNEDFLMVDEGYRHELWKIHYFDYGVRRANNIIDDFFENNKIQCERNNKILKMTNKFKDLIEEHWEKLKSEAKDHILVEGFIPFTLMMTSNGDFVPKILSYDTYTVHVKYDIETEKHEIVIKRKHVDSLKKHNNGKRDYSNYGTLRIDIGSQIPKNDEKDNTIFVMSEFSCDPIIHGNNVYFRTITHSIYMEHYEIDYSRMLNNMIVQKNLNPKIFLEKINKINEAKNTTVQSRYVDAGEDYQKNILTQQEINRKKTIDETESDYLIDLFEQRGYTLNGVNTPYKVLTGDPMTSLSRSSMEYCHSLNMFPLPSDFKVSSFKEPSMNLINIEPLEQRYNQKVMEIYGLPSAIYEQGARNKGNVELYDDRILSVLETWKKKISTIMTKLYNFIYRGIDDSRRTFQLYVNWLRPKMLEKIENELYTAITDNIDRETVDKIEYDSRFKNKYQEMEEVETIDLDYNQLPRETIRRLDAGSLVTKMDRSKKEKDFAKQKIVVPDTEPFKSKGKRKKEKDKFIKYDKTQNKNEILYSKRKRARNEAFDLNEQLLDLAPKKMRKLNQKWKYELPETYKKINNVISKKKHEINSELFEQDYLYIEKDDISLDYAEQLINFYDNFMKSDSENFIDDSPTNINWLKDNVKKLMKRVEDDRIKLVIVNNQVKNDSTELFQNYIMGIVSPNEYVSITRNRMGLEENIDTHEGFKDTIKNLERMRDNFQESILENKIKETNLESINQNYKQFIANSKQRITLDEKNHINNQKLKQIKKDIKTNTATANFSDRWNRQPSSQQQQQNPSSSSTNKKDKGENKEKKKEKQGKSAVIKLSK